MLVFILGYIHVFLWFRVYSLIKCFWKLAEGGAGWPMSMGDSNSSHATRSCNRGLVAVLEAVLSYEPLSKLLLRGLHRGYRGCLSEGC